MNSCDNLPPWLTSNALSQMQAHKTDNPDELAYFAYDLDKLNAHLKQLQNQDVIKLWYAVKANPLSSILKTLDKRGFNFDVASAGELSHVLEQQVPASRILNTGPAKSKAQLTEFLQKGVNTFVVESISQIHTLNEVAAELSIKPDVLLRVQLQWPEGEKNPLGGNSLTPFGLSTEDWLAVNLSELNNIEVIGLHIFQWGNMLSNEKMYDLWSQMVAPLVELSRQLNFDLKVLDLGGGLGVDYLESGDGLNWQQTIADLAKVKAEAGVEELWLELGRYAVAECGYYVTSVVDRKTNFGTEQLVLAAGINHIIRPAITTQPFPVRLLRSSTCSESAYRVHGPLCTSLDDLGTLLLPADTSIDDKLVFGLTGAYGFTESMPFFLCHQVAAEYVIEGGCMTEVRAAQPASWYLK